MEGFLRYRFGALIFGGAFTWRGLFSEFYGIYYLSANEITNHLDVFFPAKVAIYYVAIATAILHINFSREGLAGISLIGL